MRDRKKGEKIAPFKRVFQSFVASSPCDIIGNANHPPSNADDIPKVNFLQLSLSV
jgi:hypothetical protein